MNSNSEQTRQQSMIRELEYGINQAIAYIADARYMFRNAKGTGRRAKIAAELMHYRKQQERNERWLKELRSR